jgi:hypothetical protein
LDYITNLINSVKPDVNLKIKFVFGILIAFIVIYSLDGISTIGVTISAVSQFARPHPYLIVFLILLKLGGFILLGLLLWYLNSSHKQNCDQCKKDC